MATCKEIDAGSDHITQLCNLCDSNVSDGFCGECEEYMCKSCFDIHSRVRACRHHELLDNASENDTKKTFIKPCKQHPNQNLKYYCIGHGIVGCVECFFEDHRNCQHQNIEDAAKTFKDSGEDTRLKSTIQRLESEHSQYTEKRGQDHEAATVINDTVVKGVKSFKDTVYTYVAKVEALALETAEKLRLENETRLEQRTTELDSIGEDIEICTVKLDNRDSDDQLFVAALEIKPKVDQLQQRLTALGCQKVVKKYEFQPNKLLMEMFQKSRSVGEVCVLPEERHSKHTEASRNVDEVETVVVVQDDTARSSLEQHFTLVPTPTFSRTKQTGVNESSLMGLNKTNYNELAKGHVTDENPPVSVTTVPRLRKNIAPPSSMFQSFFNKGIKRSEYASSETCVICMDPVTDPKTIKCGHTFCTDCIDQQFQYQKKCPTCGTLCGVITGDQPDGTMIDGVNQHKRLPGYEDVGTINITYNFYGGKQKECHPSPGQYYKGIQRTAYLPNNAEGRNILKMLRVAFDRKLTFTIGNSSTTGQEGVITWNNIHHKTDHRPNTQFGYPDPTYLARVKDELAAKGVTEDDI